MIQGQLSSENLTGKLLSTLKNLHPELLLKTLEQDLSWREENLRCELFEPNGAQEKFIQVVGNKGGLVSIFSAANGVGKSALVVNILANVIFGPQNSFFDYEIFKKWPYPKRARFVTDPKLVEEIGPLHSEIRKWWPKGRYEAIKAGKQYYSQYKSGEWVLDVMSYDQDPRQFEGSTLGLCIFDEPPPRSLWATAVSRMRQGGLIIVAMTPLTQAAWFFDEVVPRHQESIVYAAIEDNCKEHGIRGQFNHKHIESMIAEMSPDEVEARAYGKAMYLAGLIFKTFDPKIHITQKNIPVPEYAQMWQIVDPAIDKPFACIWGYPERDGSFMQVAEWPKEDFYKMHRCDLSIQDYRRIFANIEQGWTVRKRIIDRHFADVRSLSTNKTLREDFANIGIHFEPSYRTDEEVDQGILKVRDYLRYNPDKPVDTLNRPRYYVSPDCVNTIKGFQRWSFDLKTGKPKDEYKDFMDCVRYALMANPKISDTPPAPEYKRLFA